MVVSLTFVEQWHLVIIVELHELQQKSNFEEDHSACDVVNVGGDLFQVADQKGMSTTINF